MSEYQYYEFQAVERPLTPAQIAELRKTSTRAKITPTQLQNVYHYGDFGGDPLQLMERYFDAFVYVANWGTRQFMVRLPRGLLDPRATGPYEVDGALNVHAKGDVVILELISRDEDEMGWITDEEAASWMPALLPLRAELASGDARALYLGWLAAAGATRLDDEDGEGYDEDGDFDDLDNELNGEEREPPPPPGLGRLSASLEALTRFLRIDENLLAVAAEGSPDLPAAPTADDFQRWIALLPTAEKDALLSQLVSNPAQAHAEITRRFRQSATPPADARAGGRTVAQLRAAAAARQEIERARRERAAALARVKRLDSLVGREDALWRQVDALIETKRPKDYDQAVQILKDLQDLSDHQQQAAAFTARLAPLRAQYAKRTSLMDRLDKAGLRA